MQIEIFSIKRKTEVDMKREVLPVAVSSEI